MFKKKSNSINMLHWVCGVIIFTFIPTTLFAEVEAQVDTEHVFDSFLEQVVQLEEEHGGRLGVALIRTKDNTLYSHRGAERFPMCSTFKVVAVASLLQKSQTNPSLLEERIYFTPEDIVPFSYAIDKYKDRGITLKEICREMMIKSDNTAANLLIGYLGGPQAVTDFAREIGDEYFRIDRLEIDMNNSEPGNIQDTTTPVAMVKTLYNIVLGDVLEEEERTMLTDWMKRSLTGSQRIRAGATSYWTVADKTGTGDYGTTNAIAVLYPPRGTPLVLVVFYTNELDKDADANNEIIAEVARLATEPFKSKK